MKFKVPITKESVNEMGIKTIPIRFNVKGTMEMIKRTIFQSTTLSTKEKTELINEYAKFWVFDKMGMKIYPLEK